jgi:hypothetical protein
MISIHRCIPVEAVSGLRLADVGDSRDLGRAGRWLSLTLNLVSCGSFGEAHNVTVAIANDSHPFSPRLQCGGIYNVPALFLPPAHDQVQVVDKEADRDRSIAGARDTLVQHDLNVVGRSQPGESPITLGEHQAHYLLVENEGAGEIRH